MAVNKAKEAYRKWYEANREAHNRARRSAYASDPKIRDKALEKQREYRKNKEPAKANGKHFRQVGSAKVEVFRIGTVAEMIGRDIQVIRLWEKKGAIPAPTIDSPQRFYTKQQVKLLSEFVELMNEVRYDPKVRPHALKKKSDEIKALWGRRK